MQEENTIVLMCFPSIAHSFLVFVGNRVHQSDFRGFTIKPTKANKPKANQAKEVAVEIRVQDTPRRTSSRRQTTLQLRGPETSIPKISDTISRNDTSKTHPSTSATNDSSDEAPAKKTPAVRPRPKARSAKTPTKANGHEASGEKSRDEKMRAEGDFFRKAMAPVQTPSTTKTRSSSRQSGESECKLRLLMYYFYWRQIKFDN